MQSPEEALFETYPEPFTSVHGYAVYRFELFLFITFAIWIVLYWLLRDRDMSDESRVTPSLEAAHESMCADLPVQDSPVSHDSAKVEAGTWRRLGSALKTHYDHLRRGRSIIRAFWFTELVTSIWIFYNTARKSYLGTLPPVLQFIFLLSVAVLILWLMMAFEGMEFAYTELRDKEANQLANQQNLFHRIHKEEKSFYDAREWCVALLAVGATLLVEAPAYRIPFVGVWRGEVARWVMTISLTILPLVWFAQGPGKALAEKNSLSFMDHYLVRLAYPLLSLVRFLTSTFRLDSPTHYFEKLIEDHSEGFHVGRNLRPGKLSFFTDSLKRFGYASLDTEDRYVVEDDGSSVFRLRDVVYIGAAMPSYHRTMAIDVGFLGKPNLMYEAFEVPAVGESVGSHLKNWLCLANRNRNPNLKMIDTSAFTRDIDIVTTSTSGGSQDSAAIHLNFHRPLPVGVQRGAAMLLRITITGRTKPRSYKAPSLLQEEIATAVSSKVTVPAFLSDGQYKRFTTPCLNASIIIKLRRKTGIFTNASYNVNFDNRLHSAETNAFCASQSDPDAGVSTDGSSIRIVIDSPLPADYFANWKIALRA